MHVLAVIPARGGSKRLPGKNVRHFYDKPLIQWSLDFAASVPWFDRVELSTDDVGIAACAASCGYPVDQLRPAHLATDEASSVDVVLELLDRLAAQGSHFDTVALLQPTTPIRDATHWEQARALLESGADAAVGVAPAAQHPSLAFRRDTSGLLASYLPRPASWRAQDLEPAFTINGALYLIKTAVLQREQTFFPPRSQAVVMDAPLHNLDIDTEFDWQFAQWVTQHHYGTT